jgi:8-oxo-dGTP pyrophosphatase MutT (NUDIX family)
MNDVAILSPIPEQTNQAKIVNPLASRKVGDDRHLPAVSKDRLNPTYIESALNAWQSVTPLSGGDGHRFAGRTVKQAAVLMGLVDRGQGAHLVLTQRANHLRNHAGQIALPGGACDPTDSNSWVTALREAQEEVALVSDQATCVGRFHAYSTVTAFEVIPWVAWLACEAQFKRNPAEVEQVFEVSLSHLLNPAHHERRLVNTPAGERTFYAIPSVDSMGVERFIWGATAGIVRNFYQTLTHYKS